MHALTALLAAEHLADLRCEAEASRLSRLAANAAPTSTPAWRRLSGRGVRGISDALNGLASRLDPDDCTVEPSAI